MSTLRGRFGAPTAEELVGYSSSIGIDLRMAAENVAGSKAHARMLGEVGVLTSEEAERLVAVLDEVGQELADGTYRPGDELEDVVHMAVEARLVEKVGDLGRKLHTARSRNDQVATDVRLWLKRRVADLDAALAALVAALLDRVEADGQALMPGSTHLQRGQPIFLGHHLLGHVWPLVRDRRRLADALVRRLEEEGRNLSGIGLAELRRAHPGFPDDAPERLDPRRAAESRRSLGGTAWHEVERQVAALRQALS